MAGDEGRVSLVSDTRTEALTKVVLATSGLEPVNSAERILEAVTALLTACGWDVEFKPGEMLAIDAIKQLGEHPYNQVEVIMQAEEVL